MPYSKHFFYISSLFFILLCFCLLCLVMSRSPMYIFLIFSPAFSSSLMIHLSCCASGNWNRQGHWPLVADKTHLGISHAPLTQLSTTQNVFFLIRKCQKGFHLLCPLEKPHVMSTTITEFYVKPSKTLVADHCILPTPFIYLWKFYTAPSYWRQLSKRLKIT